MPKNRLELFNLEVSLVRRAMNTARRLRYVRWRSLRAVRPFVAGKKGLEIGGPSHVFADGIQPLPIYPLVGSLDNCDFSRDTTWASHEDSYIFSPGKPPGKSIFRDASNLSSVADRTYDFILSSHNLEHVANPIKALYEWKRVLKSQGMLILVLPEKENTFDHNRPFTSFDHLLTDFNNNVGEDDDTHVAEVLELHDLESDPGKEAFKARAADNLTTRTIHHHVFSMSLIREMLEYCGFAVEYQQQLPPFNLITIAKKR